MGEGYPEIAGGNKYGGATAGYSAPQAIINALIQAAAD